MRLHKTSKKVIFEINVRHHFMAEVSKSLLAFQKLLLAYAQARVEAQLVFPRLRIKLAPTRVGGLNGSAPNKNLLRGEAFLRINADAGISSW